MEEDEYKYDMVIKDSEEEFLKELSRKTASLRKEGYTVTVQYGAPVRFTPPERPSVYRYHYNCLLEAVKKAK